MKLYVKQYQRDIKGMMETSMAYRTQNALMQQKANRLDAELLQLSADHRRAREKFKNADLERWAWRIGAAGAIVAFILR